MACMHKILCKRYDDYGRPGLYCVYCGQLIKLL